MAGNFHRLTTPSYFTNGGTFPVEGGVTYDYVNNAGAGTPSFADNAKIGGPNAGTYFAAFGEDATSNNQNRANKALAQNTDHLDDLLHRSLALPVRTNTATAGGGGVSSIVLPIGTYLGPSGTTNTAASLAAIFSLVDDFDNEITTGPGGSEVKVNTVTLGGGDTLGTDSFSINTVTLNISPSIPAGQNYRVYYGARGNLATMPVDAFTFIRIRGAQEVDADLEILLANLHGNNLGWNAAWTSTIYDLTMRGVMGAYDLDTAADLTPPADHNGTSAFNLNAGQNGKGGWFERLGPALTGYANTTTPYRDPLNAIFASKFVTTSLYSTGGGVGFLGYGNRRYLWWDGAADYDSQETHAPEFATFLSLYAHTQQASTSTSNVVGDSVRTRLPLGSSLSLATPDTNANTGEAVIQITTGSTWFRANSAGESAVMPGYDMLEVQYTQAATVKRESFVIVAHGSSATPNNITQVRVRRPDGKIPDFTGSSSATLVGWHSMGMGMSDGANVRHAHRYGYSDTVKLDGFTYAAPPLVHDKTNAMQIGVPATFIANYYTTTSALTWGGMVYDLGLSPNGVYLRGNLRADGSVQGSYTSFDVVEGRRFQPSATDQMTIDGSVGSIATPTVDLTAYENFHYTCLNTADNTDLVEIGTLITVTAVSGALWDQQHKNPKNGARCSITFQIGAGHLGGLRGSAVFGSAFYGVSEADQNFYLTRAGEYVTFNFIRNTGSGTRFQLSSVVYGG